jgi:HEAT repeat protein
VAGLLTRAGDLDEEADSRVLRRLTQAGGHDALAGTIEDLVARLREGSAPERARPLLVWLAPESVEPLIRALDDHIAQREAIIALGSIHDSRAVEKLCSILLGDDDPPIRMAAAWALGEIRDPAAVEALLVATGDGDYRVRAEAGVSFDKLGNAAIAVAMSALIRPALENGAAPPTDAIAADDEGPALPEGSVEEPEPESAPVPQPARPQPRPSQPTAITRAEPVLRRLLGRRSNP